MVTVKEICAYGGLIVVTLFVNVVGFFATIFIWPNTRLFRKIMAYCQMVWVGGVALNVPTANLVVSGDMPSDDFATKCKRPIVVIANHQVDADWYYIWMLAREWNCHGLVKIILKESIKKIPLIGTGISLFEFIFLARDWKKDQPRLISQMDSFVDDEFPCWLFIFPEGTTINEKDMEKSKSFCAKTNRPIFKNLISPRVTGLKACLSALEEHKPDVYDITIGYDSYTGEIPTWDMGYTRKKDIKIPRLGRLLTGEGPPGSSDDTVHLNIKKYNFEETFQDVEKWLDDVWTEKDAKLEEFAKHNEFPDSITKGTTKKLSARTGVVPFAVACIVLLVFGLLFFAFWWLALPCCAIGWAYFKFFTENCLLERHNKKLTKKIK